MDPKPFDINKLKIASPCPVAWQNMTGDDRQRHCSLCDLNVYNIAGMTAAEVEQLLSSREGRLCIRLYRRADGTVITKDCPVGVRVYQKRVAAFAGAAFAAVLGLFSISFGQKGEKSTLPNLTIERTLTNCSDCKISGVVTDYAGAAIAAAKVRVSTRGRKNVADVTTDDRGSFTIPRLAQGKYSLEISISGFKKLKVEDLTVAIGEDISMTLVLEAASQNVTIGIYADEPLIDTGSTTVMTTITSRQIDRIPH